MRVKLVVCVLAGSGVLFALLLLLCLLYGESAT
jgi:hypothetical protein